MNQQGPPPFLLLATTLMVLTALLCSAVSVLASSPKDLASDLARLRSEVEALSAELQLQREQQRNRVRVLAQQKAEVEAEVRRAERGVATLSASLEAKEAKAKEHAQAQGSYKPTFERCVALVEAGVKERLPFRTVERLASLKTLRDQCADGTISPPTALARLWSIVEDELRLGRDTGLFKATIQLNGEERLAEVVKVGMLMLLFQTADGQLGYAHRAANAWRYIPFDMAHPDGQRQAEQTLALFSAMKKRIKTGLFTLPNALNLRGNP
jgi:hypothetical protein